MGIKAKILVPTIVLVLLVAAAVLASNIARFSRFVDEVTVARVEMAARVVEDDIDSLKNEAMAASLAIARDPAFVGALAAGSQEGLLARAKALGEEAGAEFCTVTGPEGRVLARTHAPLQLGDSQAGQANIASAMAGKPLAGIETGSAVRLAVRAGAPVYGDDGRLLGVASAGFRLDSNTYVDSIKEMMGCEVTVVLGDNRVATTVRDATGARITGTRADAHIVNTVYAGQPYSGRVDVEGRMAVCKYIPLFGSNGRVLGMLFIGQYFDQELSIIGSFVQMGLIVTAFILAAAIALILFITGRIVGPIRAMTKAAKALAVGDTDLDIRVNTKDEMRTLAEAFNSMIANTRRQVALVENIANGELAVGLQARGEKDVMNRALDKLNAALRAQVGAMREEHERIRLMLDATPLASRLWDKNYNIIECNEAAVRLFGLKDKAEYLRRYYELAPKTQPDGMKTRDKAKMMVKEAFENGTSRYEWLYQMPDGTPVPAEVTMVRVPYGDGFVVAAYSRDLREQREMMAELQDTSARLEAALADAEHANSAKSNFLAHMSHEIRTPLNAVVGLSELALDSEGTSGEVGDKLEKIHASGMTILSIVNDILDISKIESGKFELLPVRYDTPSLINDVAAQNVVRIGEKPVSFRLQVDEELPGALVGDDLRVKQVFNNLLSNAFKYTNAGTVEWRVGFEQEGDKVWLVSSVRDTGIGMKPEDMQKLFLDYLRVNRQMSHGVEGTGLGLSITKRLVEMMDGSITVESVHGEGSCFHVRLLQHAAGEAPIGKELAENLAGLRYTLSRRARNKKLPRVDLSYARVLVVDDIETNLDVVRGMLKPYGLKVDCATAGRQAVEMMRAGEPRYSAIFMDHMMPEIDGIEALRIIREEIGTEYARNIPVIALTANAIMGNEEMFLNQGFQAFLSKPIDIAKLDSVLRRWVRNKDKEARPGALAAPPPEDLPGAQGPAALRIDGVDTEKALERFAGSEEVFLDVLRSYSANTRALLGRLEEHLAAGNMDAYAIAVHGVKGASYGIAAQEAGKLAEGLEMAARAGQAGAVKASHAAFEAKATALLDAIDAATEAVGGEHKPLAPAPQPMLLAQLRSACAAFDMDGVDAAMEALEAFRYESGEELVAWLRRQIDNMDFEAVIGLDLSRFSQWDAREQRPPRKAREPLAEAAGPPDFIAPEANILVVDDNETNLKLAQGLLKPLKMHVELAKSGESALRMLQKKNYHLVFMDKLMPKMDGVETTRRLREMEDEYYQKLPVIALSAQEGQDIRAELLQAGFSDFAKKPMDMKEIRAMLWYWLPVALQQKAPQSPKRARRAPPAAKAPADSDAPMPRLEGIDTNEGMRHSKTKELYFSLLGDFCRLIDQKAAHMEDLLAKSLFKDLTTEAHALKNSARIIGARALSRDFARLESCGDNEDWLAMERETPGVLDRYKALKPVLELFVKATLGKKRRASSGETVALLNRLSAALERFDLDDADATLALLERLQMPAKCAAQMEALRTGVADVASEQALAAAKALIEMLGG